MYLLRDAELVRLNGDHTLKRWILHVRKHKTAMRNFHGSKQMRGIL
jgi:hypothetical protein